MRQTLKSHQQLRGMTRLDPRLNQRQCPEAVLDIVPSFKG